MKNKKWKYSVWAKAVSWIILVTMACLTATLGIGIKIIQADNFYNSTFQVAEKAVMINEAGSYQDANRIIQEVVSDSYSTASERGLIKNATFKVADENGKVLLDETTTAKNVIQFDIKQRFGYTPST